MMPRGIYDRKVKEVDEEFGLTTAQDAVKDKTTTQPELTRMPKVEQVVEKHIQPKANEFDDEYTLQVVADYDPSADIFRIPNKDPNFEYRFLRDDPKRLTHTSSTLLHQQGGWELCPKKHLQRIGIGDKFIGPDGFYRMGELILAFMPKKYYDQKLAGKEKKAKDRMVDIHRVMKEGKRDVGGKEMHSTMRGIEPINKWKGYKQEE